MSPAMHALQSVGVTNAILILAVLFVVAAGVIGMFWHIILPGAIMIGVACLFVSPSGETTVEKSEKIENKVESVVKEESFDERQAYMKDCMEIAQYPMAKCAALWDHREEDEPVVKTKVDKVDVSELQLIDVDNKEYKARRAEALQKPGAVVGHVTYR